MRTDQRNGLDIAQTAEPVEKTINRLTKGTDERVSGNQDIFALLQLIGYEASLRSPQLLIRIDS